MEALELSLVVIGLLFAAGILAGFIDTLVGGGGLITLPALMAAGVPPIFALGTNKLQSAMGTGTASLSLLLMGKVSFAQLKLIMLAAFAGSLLGSLLVQFFDAQVLYIVIPIVILVIAVYFVLSPKQVLTQRSARFSQIKYASSAVPAIGFYDGMFGPGTGSFFVLAGVSLRGQTIVDSTVVAKALNFATNFAALLLFAVFGKVLWKVGGIMMLGQFIGATVGARVLVDIDPAILRYMVIVVSVVILFSWGANNYV